MQRKMIAQAAIKQQEKVERAKQRIAVRIRALLVLFVAPSQFCYLFHMSPLIF
jgi:hypothetical protein